MKRKIRKVLECFAPLDFYTKQDDTLKTRQAGTGEWLLRSTVFEGWVDKRGTLWCPGIRA